METLRMSRRERKRLELLSRVGRSELTLAKAAELLGLSYRQAKRVYRRYREEQDAGLVHRLRGRASNRRTLSAEREEALQLYRDKYADFGPTLAVEYLTREDGQKLTVSTLRRWLMSAGLWKTRKSGPKHRRWRARKEHVGEMLQMDGSHHDWFEGRRAWAVLMVMIDDATNRTYGRFFEEETTVACMTTFQRYVEQHGLPRSLYVDRAGIYEPTRDASVDEELAETGPLTQFGRAMQELDVELILAHSPQAKGRVERRHGVFQDRLVKAMRLAKLNELDAANSFLEEKFLPDLNARFTLEPKQLADVHRRVSQGVRLADVLSFQESRVVQNDWTLQWRCRHFQLTEANQRLALVRQKVLVCEHLDGTVHLKYRDRELPFAELVDRPQRTAKPSTGPTGLGRVGTRPAADHPWRGYTPPTEEISARPPCSASVAALPARSTADGAKKKAKPKPR
jgi:molybdenum-dependent DNA-binding transcriptional regulator ModE